MQWSRFAASDGGEYRPRYLPGGKNPFWGLGKGDVRWNPDLWSDFCR